MRPTARLALVAAATAVLGAGAYALYVRLQRAGQRDPAEPTPREPEPRPQDEEDPEDAV